MCKKTYARAQTKREFVSINLFGLHYAWGIQNVNLMWILDTHKNSIKQI